MTLKILCNSITIKAKILYLFFALISSCKDNVSKDSNISHKDKNTKNIDSFFNEIKEVIIEYDKTKMLKNFNFPLIYSENPKDPKSTSYIFFKDLDTNRNFGKYMLPYLKQINGADKRYDLNDSITVYYNDKGKDLFLQDDCLINFYVLKKHEKFKLIKFESICE